MKKNVKTKIKIWELISKSSFSDKDHLYCFLGDSLGTAISTVLPSDHYYIEINQEENTVSVFQGKKESYATRIGTYPIK